MRGFPYPPGERGQHVSTGAGQLGGQRTGLGRAAQDQDRHRRRPFDRLRTQRRPGRARRRPRGQPVGPGDVGGRGHGPVAEHPAFLDLPAVDVPPAEPDAERPGERGLHHPGVGAGVLPRVPAHHPQHPFAANRRPAGPRAPWPARRPGPGPSWPGRPAAPPPSRTADSAASGGRSSRPGCSPRGTPAAPGDRRPHPRAAGRPRRRRCSRPPTRPWPGPPPTRPGSAVSRPTRCRTWARAPARSPVASGWATAVAARASDRPPSTVQVARPVSMIMVSGCRAPARSAQRTEADCRPDQQRRCDRPRPGARRRTFGAPARSAARPKPATGCHRRGSPSTRSAR